jgi:hypothetical protein
LLFKSMLSRASFLAGSVAIRKAVRNEKNWPGRLAERDHAVAAIEQAAGDREAAKHFHQRAGAVGHPRHLVGVALDGCDVLVDAIAHRLFERERLHRANALQRFLHRFENVGGAEELVVGKPLDPLHQLAQDQHRRRRQDESQQRHQRVLDHHHDDEADQLQQVAADRVDELVQNVGDRFRSRGEARQKLRGMPLREEADALVHQLGEQPALIAGEDRVGDLRQDHAVTVSRYALDDKYDHRHARQHRDAGDVPFDIGLVDHLAEKIGRSRRRSRRDAHQNEGHQVTPPISGRLLRDQAADQNRGAIRVVADFLRKFGHPRSPMAPGKARRASSAHCPLCRGFSSHLSACGDSRP